MIHATELRIGNWVWKIFAPYGRDQDKEYIKIDLEEMKRVCGVLSPNNFRLEPIPLSPEILEKIGFVKRFPDSETCNIWDQVKGYKIGEYEFNVSLALLKAGWKYLSAPGSVPFQYVHQLQNLYYAISNQELSISL